MTISREEKIEALIEDAKSLKDIDIEELRKELESMDDDTLELGYTLMVIAREISSV